MSAPASAASRRSYVTIFFSDLTDSTGLAAGLEAEDYAAMLGQVRAVYQEVIPRRGGTIVQVAGDGLLAMFGNPRATEDDARHAIESALEIHERVRAIHVPGRGAPAQLAMHSGIHSGLVLLQLGDAVHGRFELLGDATNIASRLANAAVADEIIVSEMTLGPKRALYRTSERRSLSVRGRIEPISVFRILGRAATPVVSRGSTSFIGRAPELATLVSGLEAAMAGATPRLAIVGSPGVGKTRLAEELLVRAAERGCAVHRGHCDSSGGAALQPVLQILRSILNLDPTLSAAALTDAVAARLDGLGMDAAEDRAAIAGLLSAGDRAAAGPTHAAVDTRIADALRQLVDRASRAAPLALFIDDWQWADDATRRMIAKLDRLPPATTLLVAARSAGDAGVSGATIVTLAPFTERETAAKIAQLIRAPVPALARDIGACSGGNPLFIEELCHSVRDGQTGLEWPVGGRGWLDMLIASRFGQLAATPAALVEVAAIIGNVVPAWLFERVAGRDCADPVVRSLADEDFLFLVGDGSALRFKHGITRDAIYNAIGLQQRRTMHARVAAALHEQAAASIGGAGFNEELAYHHAAAGDDAEAAHHAELAGDAALAASALDRAEAQYRAALAALDRLPPSEENHRRASALLERLGLAAVYDPSSDHLAIFRQAAERAESRGDRTALASASYWLAYITYALGEGRDAIALCERVVDLAAGNDPLLVQTRTVLGQACAATVDYDCALALLDETLPARRQRHLGVRAGIGTAYALACRAAVLADRGEFAAAHACFDEALRALGGASHEVEGSVLCWWSAVCLWQGHVEEALRHARAAEAIAQRVRTRYVSAMGRALGGFARWTIRRSPDALEAIESATMSRGWRGGGLFVSLNHGWLTTAMAAASRPADARLHAALTLAYARRGDRLGEAMACRAMARAAAAGAGHRSARHYLALAAASARARQSPHEAASNRLCEAEIALDSEDRARAAPLLDEAEAAFETMDMRWHLTRAAALRERF